jgi:glycosyltransferase involved in cell wall biosynthesis
MDFIITSLQQWDAKLSSNAKDIAIELAKQHHRVIFVTIPTKGKSKQNGLCRQTEYLWVLYITDFLYPLNKMPGKLLFDFVNRRNNHIIFSRVNKAMAELKFTDAIHFCDNDVYRSFYAREILKCKLFIYYRRDNLHPITYWSKHIGRMEPAIIKKSDIVMCNSLELTTYATQYKDPSRIFDVGQGVNLSLYQPDKEFAIPEDCIELPHPIIGYMGVIYTTRLDSELLYKLAKRSPHHTYLFVGEEDSTFAAHPIHKLENVHFVGMKPPTQLGQYLSLMDVCINPQLLNEVTIGNYPRKIDEYLAMGKPVVATNTRTMHRFGKFVYLCNSIDEYQNAIEQALKENTPAEEAKRIAFANTHSWTNCVHEILQLCTRFLP